MPDVRMPGVKYGFDASYDARAELEDKVSTDAIMNRAAQKAGCLKDGEAVHITGDDRTYAETKDEQSPYAGANFGTVSNGADALEKGLDIVSLFSKSHTIEAASEFAGLASLPLTAVSLVHDQVEAWQNGEARSDALHKDMMHVALVANLALPDGFRAAEAAKRPEAAAGWHAPAAKIAEQLAQQPMAKIVLQVRCDEGMHIAEQFAQSGRTLDDFMKAHEGLAKRYHCDAAFRAGFDGMVWAHAQGPEQLKNATIELHARDARFDANSNRVWSA